VHHHHPSHIVPPAHSVGQQPYPVSPYGYPGYPGYIQQLPTSTSDAPGTEFSSSEQPSTTADSAAAYEAAQSILKAINFGGLLKLPPDEDEQKEAASQPPHTVGNGVEHLLSHVQAVLASRNPEEATVTSGPLPGIMTEVTPSILPSLSAQAPENKRAELQAQLALLSAQLAEVAQIEESRVASDQTVSVGSFPVPPMHSLTPDEPNSPPPQALASVSPDIPMVSVTPVSAAVDHASTSRQPRVIAASAEEEEEESDEDDMEAVI
jgi:hypothetical protein